MESGKVGGSNQCLLCFVPPHCIYFLLLPRGHSGDSRDDELEYPNLWIHGMLCNRLLLYQGQVSVFWTSGID